MEQFNINIDYFRGQNRCQHKFSFSSIGFQLFSLTSIKLGTKNKKNKVWDKN
jgi:hypothetical protein